MQKIHFIMIGGFLGAGKTTCIARLARHFTERGKRIAIVTNDQAYDLVDTHSLRSQGFKVGEVPGSCFCCRFDDLVNVVGELSSDQLPEIIIAEPVGSCTDLMATVIEPMRQLYGGQFQLGPLAVLLKPEHGRKILREENNVGFSPKAAYIFLKQIEEANIVAINKIDKLTDAQQSELLSLVAKRFPDKKTIRISSRNGDGMEELIELVQQVSGEAFSAMDVDYEVYAEGEAELGWLNCQLRLDSPGETRFELDRLVMQLTEAIAAELKKVDLEPAHLKIMGQYNAEASVANLVDSGSEVELSLMSEVKVPSAELIVNARVAGDPESLERVIRRSCEAVAVAAGLEWKISGVQSFRPGRPVPTHRFE